MSDYNNFTLHRLQRSSQLLLQVGKSFESRGIDSIYPHTQTPWVIVTYFRTRALWSTYSQSREAAHPHFDHSPGLGQVRFQSRASGPSNIRRSIGVFGWRSTSFAAVAAMQEIAPTCLPALVPTTHRVCVAANAEGRRFHFSVMDFVEGRTLEEAWDGMDDENRVSVVGAIVDALTKLHSMRLSDRTVQDILGRALGGGDSKDGNSCERGSGWALHWVSGKRLSPACRLRSEAEASKALLFYSIELIAKPTGLGLQSSFEDVGSVVVSQSDMTQWPEDAVLCHNDLTPRNLILSETVDGGKRLISQTTRSSIGNLPGSILILMSFASKTRT